MSGYHDYVLGLIPLALLGVTVLLSGVGLSLVAAVPVGGAVASLLVGHAMFVRGPTTDRERATARNAPARTVAPGNAD